MKSSWPVLIGFFAVTVAAFIYDARNEAAAAGSHPAPPVVGHAVDAIATR